MIERGRNADDDKLVKEYLLSVLMMETLEYDIAQCKNSKMKMSGVYVRVLRKHQLAIEKDLYDIRKGMRERGIKVYEESRNEKTIDAKFLCRGYHFKMSMLWSLVRSEIQVRLCERFGIKMSDPE